MQSGRALGFRGPVCQGSVSVSIGPMESHSAKGPIHVATDDTLCMTQRAIERIVKRVANRRQDQPSGVPSRPSPHLQSDRDTQKDFSLPALQRLLGHDRLTATEIYHNLSPEDGLR